MVSGRFTQVRNMALVFFPVLMVLCMQSLVFSQTISTTGGGSPAYDASDPWVVDEDLFIGFLTNGTLSVTAGGTVTTQGVVFVGSPDAEYHATGVLAITGLGTSFSVDPMGESMLFIGPLAEGVLTLSDQATLTTHDAIIAGSPLVNEEDEVIGVVEGLGYASVSGGAQWNLGEGGWLTVGGAGQGELAIVEAGSTVIGDTSEVGLLPGSIGDVLVDQSGAWILDSDLIVGVWGAGSLTVSGGGQVQSERSWVGGADRTAMNYEQPIFDGLGEPNGTGSVVVSGVGSQWNAGERLLVGSWGTGDVRIEDGGRVTAEEVFLGGIPLELQEGQDFSWDLVANGNGTITVTGEGSTLEVTSLHTLFVGYSGTGVLDVNEGGQIVSEGVVVGGTPGSTGTVFVHDEGSQLTADEELLLGAWGHGSLMVSAGGAVEVSQLMVGGFEPNDTGLDPQVQAAFGDPQGTGTIVVTGEGSSLTVLESAYIGYSGDAFVDVNEGGAVDSLQTVVGVTTGGYGRINIDGAGSVWQVTEDEDFEEDTGKTSGVMIVGGYGEGVVNVTNAGRLAVDDRLYVGGYPSEGFDEGFLGGDPNGTGAVNITGEESTVQTNGLVVGFSGQGAVTVQDGGGLFTHMAVVGFDPNSDGHVLVDGAGSLWQNSGSMMVGAFGRADVTVSNEGQLSVGQGLLIGGFDPEDSLLDLDGSAYEYDPNNVATFVVTGEGSLVEAYAVGVGFGGTASLQVLNGGMLQSQIGAVGILGDAAATVLVDGEGSTWRLTGDGELPDELGTEGQGSLVVSNGGLVEVLAPQAILVVDDKISVGFEGEGTLAIRNGGTVISDSLVLGGTDPEYGTIEEYLDPEAELGSGSGFAIISGAGSTLDVDDEILVGFAGLGSLTIEDGGTVFDTVGWLGVMPEAEGTALVTGEDSAWINSDNLVVGVWGQGDLTVADGARVSAPEVYIGGMPLELLGRDYDPDLVLNGTGTVTVTGEGSQLEVMSDDTLFVGYFGVGVLDVNDGGQVTAGSMVVGAAPDAVGTVTISGEGSSLEIDGDTIIGAWGQGTLTIEAGADATIHYLYIGGFDAEEDEFDPNMLADFGAIDGTGVVTVTGEGSTLTAEYEVEKSVYDGKVSVGFTGQGALILSDNAEMRTTELYVGGGPVEGDDLPQFSHGEGNVQVTENAYLDTFLLVLGVDGTGEMEVSAVGDVKSYYSWLGLSDDGVGVATLSGEDSGWLNLGYMAVGAWGQGELTISDGASLVTSRMYIGGFDVSAGDITFEDWVEEYGVPGGTGVVTVSGTGSRLVLLGKTFYVGYSGEGTLDINNGGQVDVQGALVGGPEGSTGLVTIDGEGSLWHIAGGAALSAMELQGDGEVIVSNGGTIVVDEADAYLGVAGTLTVGSEGTGSSMTISDGGLVRTEAGVIGGYNPRFDTLEEYFDEDTVLSDGTGSVIVDGAESRWDMEDLMVGFSGEGTLTIANGGGVTAGNSWLGVMPGSGGFVEVLSGSTWANDDELVVGAWGSAVVDIAGAGQVYAADVYLGGMPLDLLDGDVPEDLISNGVGIVNVAGEGSALHVTEYDSLYVGYYGQGTLNVTEGGLVESDVAGVGVMPGSTGAVTVRGGSYDEEEEGFSFTPSTLHNDAFVFVGGYGEGYLTVMDGGLVDIENSLYVGGFDPHRFGFDTELVGYEPNGTGTVIVTGEGSTLYGTGLEELYVGYSGDGTLNIENGGYVESGIAAIGALPGSTGAATVDGASSPEEEEGDGTPSTWEIIDSMVVGGYGSGELTVSNGGQVYVGDTLYIGGFDRDAENFPQVPGLDPAGHGQVTVTGSHSLLNFGGNVTLYVGYSGEGTLRILDGGMVVSQQSYIGFEENSVGSVTVTGEGSQWHEQGDLYVGYSGQGNLTIADGVVVGVDEDAFLGYGESADGAVVVTGEGSSWIIGGDLYVGGNSEGAAGLGSLFVNNDGRVTVWGEMYVWETGLVGGDGTITVMVPTTLHNYGTIAPGDDGIGTLTVEGAVVFHEGSIFAVDINNVSSDKLVASGTVNIEGGTIQVSSTGTILGQHQYEIISAGGVQGQFDALDTALLNFSISDSGLDYNDTSVWMHVAAANFDDPNIARTYNQRQVAGALQTIGGQGGNDVTDAVQDLETADDVRGAYDQLSGQTRPPLAPMTIAGSSKFLGTVTSRVQTVKTGLVAGAFDSKLLAAAGPDQALGGSPSRSGQDFAIGNGTSVLSDKRWGLWGRGYGLYGDRDSGDELPGYGYHIYGGSFGVDYQFTETLLAGLVGGVSEGDVNFDRSRDTTSFGAAHIGLYGSLAWERWNVDAVATYANLDYETRRFVDLLDERLSGNFDGSEFAAYVEVSRTYALAPNLTLAPLASVQYTYLDLDSYTETGGVSALAFESQTHESIRGSLGARLTRRLIETAGDFRADVQLRGRWVHEFGDDRASVDTSFASDPTVVFTVKDDAISRDSGVLGVGFLTELNNRTRAYFDYDARINSDETIHVLSASLQYRW